MQHQICRSDIKKIEMGLEGHQAMKINDWQINLITYITPGSMMSL